MKGHIQERQRKRGKVWYVIVDIGKDPATGKRRRHWETVRTNKRDAQVRLRELLTSLDTGAYVKSSKLTVGRWLDTWLQEYAVPRCAPKTVDSYRGIVRVHIVPALGAIPLKDLEPRHLSAFYASKRGKVSVRTVRYCHTLLRQALEYAVKMDVLSRNAAEKAEPPAREKKPVNVVQPQDIDRLLQAAPDHYRILFETLLFTGLRRGELLALRWRDVDLTNGSIHVSETMYKLNGKVIVGPPKTSASRRVVYLPPFLVASLIDYRQKAIDQHKGMKAKLKGENLVFADPEGDPFDPSTVSHAFKHLVEKAGLKDIRLHDLRHSYASLLLKSGKHPLIVSAQLGHASIRTTLDTYSHLLPGLQEEAVKDLDVYRPRQLPGPNPEKR